MKIARRVSRYLFQKMIFSVLPHNELWVSYIIAVSHIQDFGDAATCVEDVRHLQNLRYVTLLVLIGIDSYQSFLFDNIRIFEISFRFTFYFKDF